MQVSNAVPGGAGHSVSPPPHPLHVADAAAGAGGGAAEGRHGRRHVVRLRSEDYI